MKIIFVSLISVTLLSIFVFVFFLGNGTSKLISFGLASKIFTFEQSARPSKYTLMAVNIDERIKTFYFFYLPFAAQAWKRLGFQPIVLLVSTEQGDLNNFNNQNGPALKTIKYLKKLGATVKLIKSQKYYGLMTSMICRLFVGVMNLTSDAEIQTKTIIDLLEAFFSSNHVKKDNEIKRGDATWNADQIILSQKISIYSSDLNRTKIFQKPYQGIRLDRSQGLTTLMDLVDNKFSQLTDFHAFHSIFLERWIVTICEYFLDPNSKICRPSLDENIWPYFKKKLIQFNSFVFVSSVDFLISINNI
ncbi:hypothetical protein BpHYR1_046389 [Brachionus plicatilis]|uniref:Uncharacterized protein n=1 Tax=Brachionus plicatilis TaxID=10195 RepID=A0A3M7QGH6_BRAPC|nr:hypothetical protein BpHYR1_046389 [Brachionus plicatilis]